jgi:chromosome segregation ATPase
MTTPTEIEALVGLLRQPYRRWTSAERHALTSALTALQAQLAAALARAEAAEAEVARLRAALFECQEEIDAYIQQEYPHDHPVQERYRQRDYAANPARIALQGDKP